MVNKVFAYLWMGDLETWHMNANKKHEMLFDVEATLPMLSFCFAIGICSYSFAYMLS